MAGVAPKVVDLVADWLPNVVGGSSQLLQGWRLRVSHWRSQARRIFPPLPLQASEVRIWSAVASVLLLHGSSLPIEIVGTVFDNAGIGMDEPAHPLWLLPIFLAQYSGIGVAGYLIGRIDPAGTTKNLATAIYVYALMFLPIAMDSQFQMDFLASFGLGEDREPRAEGASQLVTIVVPLFELVLRGGIALYCALWGARRRPFSKPTPEGEASIPPSPDSAP
jgi:hypothetical protein